MFRQAADTLPPKKLCFSRLLSTALMATVLMHQQNLTLLIEYLNVFVLTYEQRSMV
jgi:hypothetical protein